MKEPTTKITMHIPTALLQQARSTPGEVVTSTVAVVVGRSSPSTPKGSFGSCAGTSRSRWILRQPVRIGLSTAGSHRRFGSPDRTVGKQCRARRPANGRDRERSGTRRSWFFWRGRPCRDWRENSFEE